MWVAQFQKVALWIAFIVESGFFCELITRAKETEQQKTLGIFLSVASKDIKSRGSRDCLLDQAQVIMYVQTFPHSRKTMYIVCLQSLQLQNKQSSQIASSFNNFVFSSQSILFNLITHQQEQSES